MDPINIEDVISPGTRRALMHDGLVIVRASDLLGVGLSESDAHFRKLLKTSSLGGAINIEDIIAATCHVAGIRKQHLLGPCRLRSLAWPRQAAMFITREMTDLSYPQIAKYLGNRDHTTIIHGERSVRRRLDDGHAETKALTIALRRRVKIEVRHRLTRHV